MFKNKNRRPKFSDGGDDLNIIPVMNLFMVLIPFLLLGAAFFQISVIPTSTPTHEPTEADIPETPKTVTATLMIEPDELAVTFESVSLARDELDDMARTFDKSAGDYDLDGLQSHLRHIKEQYPESTTITVLPHDDLEYQQLVDILDTTRDYPLDPDDPDTEREELFPVTVFSRMIRSEPDSDD